MDDKITFHLKWNGKLRKFDLPSSQTVEDVQKKLEELSQVEIDNQKIIGLGSSKEQPNPSMPLSSLNLKKNTKLILLGGKQELKKDQKNEEFKPILQFHDEIEQISKNVNTSQTVIASNILASIPFDKEKMEFELLKCDNQLNQIIEKFDSLDMSEKSTKFREVKKEEILRVQRIQEKIDSLLKKI